MKKKIIAIALAMTSAAPAFAAPRYDRNLEAAAQRALAERIGDLKLELRGTFAPDEKPSMSVPVVKLTPVLASGIAGWDNGLAPAREARFTAELPQVDRVVLTGSVRPMAEAAIFPPLPSGMPFSNEGHDD
ncbi:MAG: hypothetical protein KDJ73_06160 [Notoacmeibacter sp.]|nr:hypothetical protein [Notoacmeibacter sp.]MCC0033014.1 hypothetical protein [Brucellaceae bacterium]